MASAELVVSTLPPGTPFAGGLVGALERVDVIASLRVLDALFVGTDPTSGELAVFDARGRDIRTLTVELLDFRLDAAARGRATQTALEDGSGGVPAETLRAVADALEPGAALVAVLVEEGGAEILDEAVRDATFVTSHVNAARLSDVGPDLRAAAGGRR